jgi:hypothetical protein
VALERLTAARGTETYRHQGGKLDGFGGPAMRVLTILVLTFFIAGLMGCATSQEDKARLAAADNEQCISYGTTPGTPAYTDCRLKLEHQRALLASRPLPPPQFESCPTAASGLSCINPTSGR